LWPSPTNDQDLVAHGGRTFPATALAVTSRPIAAAPLPRSVVHRRPGNQGAEEEPRSSCREPVDQDRDR